MNEIAGSVVLCSTTGERIKKAMVDLMNGFATWILVRY